MGWRLKLYQPISRIFCKFLQKLSRGRTKHLIILERRERILEILEKKRTASIHELAVMLFTSEASIRRDVEALEKTG